MNEIGLIVNADDYGRTAGVSRGIREAHLRGIVSSTTALMNMPGVETELRTAMKETPKLGLGVHLVLTSGKPLTDPSAVPSLVNEQKSFPGIADRLATLQNLKPDHAEKEWRSQIDLFRRITGKTPDHLDSHHHVSFLTESLLDIFLNLAKELRCPVRFPDMTPEGTYPGIPEPIQESAKKYIPPLVDKYKPIRPDHFSDSFYDETATQEKMLSVLENLPAGTTEIMCHPGYADDEIIAGSVYNRQRERELTILTSAEILAAMRRKNIRILNFSDLA